MSTMTVTQDIIGQIANLSVASINIPLVIILLAVGYVVKHAFKKVDNAYVPIIIGVFSIVFCIGVNIPFNPKEYLLTYLVEAVSTTIVATIVHEKGKSIIDDIANKSISTTTPTSTTTESTTTADSKVSSDTAPTEK